MTPTQSSALIVAALLAAWHAAGRHGPFARIIVSFQIIFWFIGYVLRPLYLVVEAPESGPLFDVRQSSPDYETHVVALQMAVVVGLVSFALVLYLLPSRSAEPVILPQWRASQGGMLVAAWVLMVGWAGRIASIVGVGFAEGQFSLAASVGAAGVILRARGRSIPGAAALLMAIIGELLWSVQTAAKTPVITVLLALTARLLLGNSALKGRLGALAVGAGGIAVFLAIQPLKGIDTYGEVSAGTSSAHGMYVALLERWDLSKAVTDALVYPKAPWMEGGEYLSSLLLAMVPKFGLFAYENVGARWTVEVRAATVPSQEAVVNLASGVVAEGFIQAGLIGVAIESAALALTVAVLSRVIWRQGGGIFATFFSFSVLLDSSLYEGGLLAIAESVSTGVLVGFVAHLGGLILCQTRRAGVRRRSNTASEDSKR